MLKALLHPLDGLDGLDGLDVQHALYDLMGNSEALEGQGQVSGHSTVNQPQTNAVMKFKVLLLFLGPDANGNCKDVTDVEQRQTGMVN